MNKKSIPGSIITPREFYERYWKVAGLKAPVVDYPAKLHTFGTGGELDHPFYMDIIYKNNSKVDITKIKRK